jgi:hypothetical protein
VRIREDATKRTLTTDRAASNSMRTARHRISHTAAGVTLALTLAVGTRAALPAAMDPPKVKIDAPRVIAPPASFFKMIEERISSPRRGGRRPGADGTEPQKPSAEQIAQEMALYVAFYKKYIDVKGMPVAAHADVADLALQRTYDIVTHMLAGRPDILAAMVSNRTYLIIIGKNQVYFDCNRANNWNHGPVGHREQLRVYDPVGYELCRSVFQFSPAQDWRYSWLQKLPMISSPPTTPMFTNLHPWYTKFTWAREFTVVGRRASDEALLRANETIRRMFAYRHDILKALMADGVKLVVLAPDESIADLPEHKRLVDKSKVDHTLRFLTCNPEMKLLVAGTTRPAGSLWNRTRG